MELIEELQADGWTLSEEGYKTITEDGKLTDKQEILKKAVNIDIRDLGGCSFPAELTKGKVETLSGNTVVQIQKIRNISAPKANEESQAAPRLLKLILTDGTQVVPAIEMTPLSPISLNTLPGTKLKLKGEIIVSSGFLQLNLEQIELLGGVVSNLVEKWTVNRDLAKHTRGRYGVEGGPPPWISFGEKLVPTNLTDKNFKSLDDGSKENKDNDEFEAQRRDAIAEAGKTSAKKVFGGGTKPLMDKNVQIIMEKGFTIQQAEAALKQNRNNVERALKGLKRNGRGNDDKGDKEKEGGRGGRRKGEEESGPKPTGRLCLFQFLETKLPFLPEKEKPPKEPEKKEWDGSQFNHKGGYQEGGPPSGVRTSRNNSGNERSRGGGSSARGGGSSRGSYSRDYGGGDQKPKEDHHKDERNGRNNNRWQNTSHNQKPPRFQNQNKKIEPQTSDQYDHFITRNTDSGHNRNRSNNNNPDSYFASKNNNNPEHNHSQQFNGYRSNYKIDNTAQYNNAPAGGDQRNQSSSFFKPPGMPDIPAFPYKDNSTFAPIVSQSNPCIPEIPAFPYKDNSSFTQIPPSNGLPVNNVNNNRNGNSPLVKQGKHRWNKGDKCVAKYWEDDVYYEAEVTGVSEKTCVVRFLNYGNFEEVLQDHCIPQTEEFANYPAYRNQFLPVGSLEFRRGGNRPYVKIDGAGPRKNHRQTQPVYMPPPGRQPK